MLKKSLGEEGSSQHPLGTGRVKVHMVAAMMEDNLCPPVHFNIHYLGKSQKRLI